MIFSTSTARFNPLKFNVVEYVSFLILLILQACFLNFFFLIMDDENGCSFFVDLKKQAITVPTLHEAAQLG